MESEELQYELYEIFESGLFAFPIYHHAGARRIVQYLLYRGVADEEIADAIEDSTQGLWIWLHRHGKNMVGEWVIMWINDMRDEWKQEKRRQRKEERERRKLLKLSHEISPNRETTTTFGSSGGYDSGGDGSRLDLREIRASDLDLRTVASGSRSWRKKKFPEPSAPEEILLFDGEKGTSPRSPRSLRLKGSQSETALNEASKTAWAQSNIDDIRHIDSSLSTLNSESDQNESIGDILTKTSVTVIIEHVNDNDNDDVDVKDGVSETAINNQNNNVENNEEVKTPESDSEKESDVEHMDTKVTDSESENDKEDAATGGKEERDDSEQHDYVVLKKKRKHQEEDEEGDKVVVVETIVDGDNEDVNKSVSDVISETMSDYNEPRDFSSDGNESRDDGADQSGSLSILREHREVGMHLVLEGYYKRGGEALDGLECENAHDSGINTPDLTADIDPLSPTEKDFFFSKDGEFDDTFSEIFYDAENDFETSSRGPRDTYGDEFENVQFQTMSNTMESKTLIKFLGPVEQTFNENEDLFNEIKDSIESDRRLVAAILDQKQYKEIIEVDIPFDLQFPHEKRTEGKTTNNGDTRLSICSDCSLTRINKDGRLLPKRRSKDCLDIGLPVCAECRCTIVHYSYQSKPKPIDHIGYSLSNYCDVVFCDSALKAMEFNIDTLNKEGPGFIFVMTEALGDKQLPWSTEQRYKIASSRQPDRWILEFKSRNIEVDVVWQIRVQNHIKAVREVHLSLQNYNLHTNWFRCSLAVIIENVLNIASKYRVNPNSKPSTYS